MKEDELALDTLGDRKTALFVIISDTDDTFNFVVSIMYSQLFNLLCDKADDEYGGRLPVHVRCLLDEFANILDGAADFDKAVTDIIKKTLKEHKKIIFNGNNYSDEWVAEAEKRGLLNLKTTPDALKLYVSDKNINLFTKHGIYTEAEIRSRYEILLDNYSKVLHIEALTMIDMARKEILPASVSYVKELTDTAAAKKSILASVSCEAEEALVTKLSALNASLYKKTDALESVLLGVKDYSDVSEIAFYYKDNVLTAMQELRAVADEIETLVGEKYWPYPTYGELLFGVQ